MLQGPSVGRRGSDLYPLLKGVIGWGKSQVWVPTLVLTLPSK